MTENVVIFKEKLPISLIKLNNFITNASKKTIYFWNFYSSVLKLEPQAKSANVNVRSCS